MDLKNAQLDVDTWIKEHGVRYFNELTNMAQLTEEVGDLFCMIQLMIETGIINIDEVDRASANKKAKLQKWSNIFNEETVN